MRLRRRNVEARLRRRNTEGRPWWHYGLATAAGVGAGAFAGYLLGREETITAPIVISDDIQVRLPQPSTKMMFAEDLDEFMLLDELVCEIGEPLVNDAPPGTTADEVVRELQKRIALELYPDFPWPPMSGDNPTIEQLWHELGFLARKAIVTGSICPQENT